ncbi:MAG: hypothetical protein HY093_02740 [Candidatus Liptonbacteria bacterium]|nr:hypothetical protein [Candidatus Liptonbacteria bacterium]
MVAVSLLGMADFLANNNPEDRDRATYVPPPHTEVTVRTLESDVKSMALSGGGSPQSVRISLADRTPQAAPGKTSTAQSVKIFSRIFWVVAMILILGALVYFFYPLIKKDQTAPAAVNPTSTENSALPEVPAHLNIPKFEHQSFFAEPAPRVLALTVSYPVGAAGDLADYNKKILDLLARENSTSTFWEIEVKDGDGQVLSFSQFLEVTGAKVMDEDFLALNLSYDFTHFVYKDKNGFWPGFILKLNQGKTWVTLRPEIAKLEAAADLEKLFLTNPGSRAGVFRDTLISSSQPARVLKFAQVSAGLVYGYFHDYFIFSTSEAGFVEAVGRL